MALSKQQIADKLANKSLSLDVKFKVLDFANGNPTLGCRKLAEIFKIRKTTATNIIKEKNIHSEHELFHEKSKKRNCPAKYRKMYEILHEWYQRCNASNIYSNGPMLKEEAKTIKERLQDCSLDGFTTLDGWLDRWKTAYAIKERRLVGEAGDVSEKTITSWMERLQELTAGYSSENIWNMDESGYFFKALPDK